MNISYVKKNFVSFVVKENIVYASSLNMVRSGDHDASSMTVYFISNIDCT
jgi:hypothetical protein